MFEVAARDGAGRIGTLTIQERKLTTPGLFYLDRRTPEASPGWEPRMSDRADTAAVLVSTRRIQDAPPSVAGGQVLLQRRLRPTPVMLKENVHVENLDSLSVWPHAFTLLQDPKRFAPALAKARAAAGYARALYAPGLGEPHTLAVLAYGGVDLFDAIPLHVAAAKGQYLTASGRFAAAGLLDTECACPPCQGAPPSGLSTEDLSRHNHWAARMEVGVVRNALRAGRLRELVEGRVRAHPETTALLRRLDAEYAAFEERTPVNRSAPLWATTKESLQRVECRRFRERVRSRYRPPTAPPVLLLLPCSHRKPYSRSRTHRAVGEAVWSAGAAGLVHEVIVTSPLGLVPRELELCYPAQHYDVPVTGEWDPEEAAMIRDLLENHLTKRSYARVISHLPKHTYELVRGLLPPDVLVTCEGENATAPEALRRLELTLKTLVREHPRAQLDRLTLERLRALSDFQFGGDVTDSVFQDARARGRWPGAQLVAGSELLATLPPERGLLSLTLAGAQRLLAAGRHRVGIDDFEVKGSVFAVGVTSADPEIRAGDEVVLHHEGRLKGVGVALMAGPEMTQLRRGEAVKVRHHA